MLQELDFSRPNRTLDSVSLTDDDYTFSLIGNPAVGAKIIQRIVCDGISKVLFDGPKFEFMRDDSTKLETRADVTAGVYQIEFTVIEESRIEVQLKLIAVNASIAPKLVGITKNSANSSITVSFNEECYSAINKSGALIANDFVATLTGGVATVPVISVPVHTAGGKSISFTLAYTGTANGNETLKIVPAVNSVFNRGSVVMPITEAVSIRLTVV